MKNWFVKLSGEQKKKVYKLTIAASIVLYFLTAVLPIFGLAWVAALVAVLIERKIMKNEKRDADAECTTDKSAELPSPSLEIPESGTIRETGDIGAQITPIPSSENCDTEKDCTAEKGAELSAPAFLEGVDAVEISHLDFGKPAGQLGCFLNYRPRELRPPTVNQIEKLQALGVVIPDGITVEDASQMLKRVSYDNDPPRPELVSLAIGLNIKFSAFIGNRGIFHEIIYTPNHRDSAALYAYAVRQSMRGEAFGNMLEDSEVDSFYAFADEVLATPALLRSLLDRTADDYKKPYRGTKIYKAAAEFLNNGTIIN